jgi:hypothetical protein
MQIAEDRGIVVDSIKQEEDRLYANFIYSIKTESTRKNHLKFLQYYMKFVGVQTLRELVAKPQIILSIFLSLIIQIGSYFANQELV